MLAIEQELMEKLPLLFTSEMVYDLSEAEIQQLAAENGETTAARENCNEQLTVLQEAHSELKRLDKHQSNVHGKCH